MVSENVKEIAESVKKKAEEEGKSVIEVLKEMKSEGLTITEAVAVFAIADSENGETVHYLSDNEGRKQMDLATGEVTLVKSRWQPMPI